MAAVHCKPPEVAAVHHNPPEMAAVHRKSLYHSIYSSTILSSSGHKSKKICVHTSSDP